ncbi:sulfite exporter TauE/SafE [Janthinobacterium sp. HH01]|uniref:sulfite exporter TauE/SafE family protein n=1 Tax=Janthinobacterium sp. HH01 TaxID=1198452 RepID=UPI0002AE88C4|nr:sulfite exporter TauE/SafE family protein [Janthinobacterium sp. HH01]ELX09644.1 sulfite exporter TauE/SafE [Janthinobacterium sp. HH01]
MALMDTSYIFIALVFVLAGMVKGVTGMGLPTVAVALLTLKMSPLEAAALLIVPSSVTNVWQLAAGPALYQLWRRLRTMLLAVCVGTALAAVLVGGGHGAGDGAGDSATWSAAWSGVLLGLALLAYGALGLAGWRWQVTPRAERWLGPLAGVVTGALAGVTGVFVMPAAPYLQALALEKDDLVQAMGLAFTVSTLALAVMLAYQGAWHAAAAGASCLALLPAAGGMLLGQWLRGRMAPALFRRCFFASLLALGAHQCLRIFTG